MLITMKNLLFRLLGIKSPSLGGYAFDYQVWEWLGLNKMRRDIDGLDHDTRRLGRELHEQIKMVGVDIHQTKQRHGQSGVQTEIIFISHLGPEGMGSIRIVDAEFRDYHELMRYVKYTAETLKQRPVIDGPMGMGKEMKGFLDL